MESRSLHRRTTIGRFERAGIDAIQKKNRDLGRPDAAVSPFLGIISSLAFVPTTQAQVKPCTRRTEGAAGKVLPIPIPGLVEHQVEARVAGVDGPHGHSARS